MATTKDPSTRRRTTPGGRTSLATLSAHLGLSPAAISRVLNGAPAARSIPQSTQDRIFEAARALNYRPNVLARSLRRGHSMTLGVLVPEIAEGYTALVLAGVEQALQAAGYVYLLISHHHRTEVIERSLTQLSERAVDGLIAIDTALPHPLPLPTATISCHDAQAHVTRIVVDHARAADLAIGCLVGLGHREVAIIKGQAFSSDTEPRWRAIQAAAVARKLVLTPGLIVQLEEDTPTHDPGYRAAQRLLAAGLPFTALFAFNDISAIGAVRAFREAGLEVPRDVSVIGFDDIQSAAFQNPSLTTVRQPLHRMGQLAAEAVLCQIAGDGSAPPPGVVQVDPELILRESVAPVRTVSSSGRARSWNSNNNA